LRSAREARGALAEIRDVTFSRSRSWDRTSLYQEITDKIIAELEAGSVPWVQPWGTVAAKASLAMPGNAATQRRDSARKAQS
jgi:antirestriction protein ArdC